MPGGDSAFEPSRPQALGDGANGPPRGRRRRTNFGAHMAATAALVGYTHEDEAWVADTRDLLAPHVSAIADDVYRELLTHPETAAQFSDASGAIDRTLVALRREEFSDWLDAVVAAPLNADTAEYLATVGHAHARREEASTRFKARYVLATISRVESCVIDILADAVADPKELAACASAWCKRLLIHLDLLLAVYGSTESSPHWY